MNALRKLRHALTALLVAAVAGLIVLTASASGARDAIPYRWQSCKHVNAKWPHGVGKRLAHDRTKSGDPVTNFRRSTALYLTAMHYNRGLDRDKDGIACEKH